MRKTSSRKLIAIVYALGLIWVVALVGGAVVLTQPMLVLHETLGVESVAVQFAATTALLVVIATAVTVAAGLVLRSTAEPAEVSNRS